MEELYDVASRDGCIQALIASDVGRSLFLVDASFEAVSDRDARVICFVAVEESDIQRRPINCKEHLAAVWDAPCFPIRCRQPARAVHDGGSS